MAPQAEASKPKSVDDVFRTLKANTRCSIYLLYWYKSTNTDAEGARKIDDELACLMAAPPKRAISDENTKKRMREQKLEREKQQREKEARALMQP